jgi:predicted MFS family arabinose efflux permease
VLAFGVFGVFWGGWAAVLPEIRDAVGGSDASFGLALLGIGLGSLPAMLAMGRIYDRYAERTVAPLLILFAGSTVLPGLTSSTPWLFLTLLSIGALTGMLDVAINAAATAWEAATHRRLLNLAHASFSGFFLVASVSVGISRRAEVGHMAILVCLALVVASAAPFNRFPKVTIERTERRPVLRFEPVFLMLGALCGLGFVVEGGLEAWSAVHLERTLEAGPAIGGLGPGLFAAAMLTGRSTAHVIGAHLSDQRILAVGSSLAAGGLVLSAIAPVIPLVLAGFVLTGLGVSVVAPTMFGVAGRVASDRDRGSAIGTVTTVAYLGFLFGPPMVGWISGATTLRFGFVFLAAIAATLAGLSVLVRNASSRAGAPRREPLPG